ncbi:TPA: Asp-tRNA(Asn)/Glu-tRNA(Gln) amidotransferase subunit GatB [Candidatus Campbellbacteria bacterium]|nr:MAG: aspartyl/glutamyl-tRNA amidotransferase subunit B, aspartyl-tRNA(Asn)/glutamyl-tRNA (Gln) amidotransferase subunit B [Candidatus Campbellbacteria bacterium GW2011_OD1_34_28]KKP75148.1 MAG: Aspartyl/glutamyl-tRNA(Asn/Gln) amidotransferase subunit B [Candidatus Campbellbacteria bacterium GW2011_GWD2_35_24]KKP76291.1 MAG: aspartyl/glutamyl-tRNA amidotransferase subunit B, aspartyl-tRNA(Asn)/glutamyl-tRNA (Gln) amidotransferase subunit B [Candidatus Campbellbacteria bacterium GW2011_GWC2_35_2
MEKYKATIGLEIHAELKTKTKMFCDSKNDPDETKPNVNICPVCMAHPGTLPAINKTAVKSVLKVGLALNGNLADFTEFDRKNYFYPDIPKGYQISQYKYPLVSGGELNGVKITRVHLEEDTARSSHDTAGHSLVDYNRAGIPLMELVTEPVVENAQQARDFAKELQLLLRYLGVAEANMEKGEMRIEANISVSDTENFGTKVEVKNLNSFKVVEKAIEYEIKRQIEAIENGEKIIQETRGWDENGQKTFSQRMKEGSADYRYFPDPDLPKLKISEIPEFSKENLKKEISELPKEKRERYTKDYGIKSEDLEMYVTDSEFGNFFEGVAKELKGDRDLIKLASNYITSDVVGLKKDSSVIGFGKIEISTFAELIKMVGEGKISSRGTKDILKIMFIEGGAPNEIAEKNNLLQKSDEGELEKIVLKIIENNKTVADEFRSGKESSLQFLIGQGMKETKGSANPKILTGLFKKNLK